jgi:hypothetical protein
MPVTDRLMTPRHAVCTDPSVHVLEPRCTENMHWLPQLHSCLDGPLTARAQRMHVRKSRLQALRKIGTARYRGRPIGTACGRRKRTRLGSTESRVFLDQTSDEDDDPWRLPTLYGLTRLWIRLVRSGPFGWCSRWVAVPVAFFRPGSLVPMSVS